MPQTEICSIALARWGWVGTQWRYSEKRVGDREVQRFWVSVGPSAARQELPSGSYGSQRNSREVPCIFDSTNSLGIVAQLRQIRKQTSNNYIYIVHTHHWIQSYRR